MSSVGFPGCCERPVCCISPSSLYFKLSHFVIGITIGRQEVSAVSNEGLMLKT